MTAPNSSGVAPQTPPVAPVETTTEPPKPETVTREAYEKAVEREKKLKEQLRAYEAEKAEREKKELEARGEYQKIAELAKKEAEELRQKLAAEEEMKLRARKFSAVLKGLGTSVEDKWYSVLGDYMDEVRVNPETGQVEEMSITPVVAKIKESWPEMLKKTPVGVPNGAPAGGNPSIITRAEWLRLPAKEMKKWKPDQIKEG